MPRGHKEREIVETAAGFGLPHDKICQLIVSERTGKPIDAKTLRSAFRAELDGSVAVSRRQALGTTFRRAFDIGRWLRSTATGR